MAEKRIHNPDNSSSADVSRVSRSRDQDGQLLCPVTLLVDSQVSDRCPWATCFYVFPMTPPGRGPYGPQGHGWQDL